MDKPTKEAEELAKYVANSTKLLDNLARMPRSDRVQRIINKALRRHTKALAEYLEIDPNMEALANSELLTDSARQTHERGIQLIIEYSNVDVNIDNYTYNDLRAMAFVATCAKTMEESAVITLRLAVAAYHIGLESGRKNNPKFQILTPFKLGTD